jgi:hypothetical protein
MAPRQSTFRVCLSSPSSCPYSVWQMVSASSQS